MGFCASVIRSVCVLPWSTTSCFFFLPLTCVFLPADVPGWLKSLRLHKYAGLFSTMGYQEMMSLTEQQLEAQVSGVGASLCVL